MERGTRRISDAWSEADCRRRVLLVAAMFLISYVVGLSTAPGANAAWDPPGVGACATVAPPPGQTGGEYWVNSEDGSCSGNWISDEKFRSLVNQGVAGADEATDTAVPSDIPASDAETGGGFWDGLKAAASDLKLNAFDALGVEEGVGLWGAIGTVALPAAGVVGGFLLADYLGNELANIVGVNAGGSGGGASPYYSVSVESVPAYFDLNKINGGIDPNNGQGYCAGTGVPTCQDIDVQRPRDGWVVLYNVNGSYPFAGVNQCFAVPDPLHLPSGAERIVIARGAGTCDAQQDDPVDYTTSVYWIPGQLTALPGPGQGALAQANQPCEFSIDFSQGCTTTTSPPSPTEAQQKASATSVLHDPAYDGYSAALCQVPGSPCPDVPPPYTVTIPTPSANETWSDYSTDLQNVGITNVRRQQLSIDQAEMSKPAGAVISVDPGAGSKIYPVTNTVTVTTNPDTMPVVVPAIEDNESPDTYTSQLSQVGLSADVQTLDETSPSAADGDVVESIPEPGDRVEPGTQVEVAANPRIGRYSQKDSRCDVGGGGPAGDPGNPPSDGTNYPAYQDAPETQTPYTAGVDPSGSTPPETQIPLRWGTAGWGWRHILRGHTYTSDDESQTIEAVATDLAPTSNWAPGKQWVFHLFYEMPDGLGDGANITCLRSVAVEYFVSKHALGAGLDGIRGIQDSYDGLYIGGLPGH